MGASLILLGGLFNKSRRRGDRRLLKNILAWLLFESWISAGPEELLAKVGVPICIFFFFPNALTMRPSLLSCKELLA